MIDQIKKETGSDRTLILNAGNNFDVASHDTSLAPPYIFKALALAGTEVIAPGLSEMVIGSERLNKMAATASVPVVSANLPGFMPYTVLLKNKGRMKVLVTSVMDPALLAKNNSAPAKVMADPVSSLCGMQAQVPHDLFVVVMHAGPEMISSVIEKCPGIDLVIDGMSPDFSPVQPSGSRPTIVANNKEGMYLAYIDYDGREKNGGVKFSKPVQQRIVVGQVAADLQVSALVKEYEQMRRKALREKSADPDFTAGFEAMPHYVGSRSCQLCHAAINDSWENSRHAEAMNSLVRESRQNDPDCLSCHVTGMEKQAPSELMWVQEDHPMAGVQCEACHGPGADHSQNPRSVGMQTVNEHTCTRCHTEFKDPGFDYSRDVHKVNHGQVKVGLNP